MVRLLAAGFLISGSSEGFLQQLHASKAAYMERANHSQECQSDAKYVNALCSPDQVPEDESLTKIRRLGGDLQVGLGWS